MKLVFHRAAVGDVEAISEYIGRDSPAAARTVARRIRAATGRLALFPHSGRAGLEPGTRELMANRTPYIVVYRVVEEPAPGYIEIIGIFHTARDRVSGDAATEVQSRLGRPS